MYKFEDYSDKILKAIDKREKDGFFGKGERNLSIVDSFVIVNLQSELSGIYNLAGRYIPLVMVIDNDTGQAYQFALTSLVPEIELS